MPLQSIAQLSDDEDGPQQGAVETSKPGISDSVAAEPEKKIPKGKAKSKAKPLPTEKAKPQPLVESQSGSKKRPASAKATAKAESKKSKAKAGPVKKRPAAAIPAELKTSVYMYNTAGREGIWGCKLNGKEVVRVRAQTVWLNEFGFGCKFILGLTRLSPERGCILTRSSRSPHLCKNFVYEILAGKTLDTFGSKSKFLAI